MKNLQLIQCAFDAFCHRNKNFLDTYADEIKELTDKRGIIAIEIMQANLARDVDDELMIDIFNVQLSASDTSDVMTYRIESTIDAYLDIARQQERQEQIRNIEKQIKSGEVGLLEALEKAETFKTPTVETFGLTTAEEIIDTANDNIDWIVADYIPAGGLVVIAGVP